MRRFTITVLALPCPIPAEVRLRKMLKVLLRWWSFRCEDITELPSTTAASTCERTEALDSRALLTARDTPARPPARDAPAPARPGGGSPVS